MQSNLLKFSVFRLLESGTGTRELFSFDSPISFDGLKVKSNIRGKLEIMRIEGGVNARLSDAEIKIEFLCEKCLEKFSQKIRIPSAERQFYLDPPSQIEDLNDLFLIDKKKFEIELTELLRQEIILHFPIITVCSESCKGICQICGKDRNQEQCDCKPQSSELNKPLAILKEYGQAPGTKKEAT